MALNEFLFFLHLGIVSYPFCMKMLMKYITVLVIYLSLLTCVFFFFYLFAGKINRCTTLF